MVGSAITAAVPNANVDYLLKSSRGDREASISLWQSTDKGLFTTDISEALVSGDADIAVHSWKDLPVSSFPGTLVAGTLERADPRDVLLVRPDAIHSRPSSFRVLTSSPRRTWQLRASISPLLPWPVSEVDAVPVRGNIPTRLEKLVSGGAHGLVVAKAALDRLLASDQDTTVRSTVRALVDSHRWMVLPLKEFPTAPAQGALALEVAAHRHDIRALVESISHEPTREAVEAERAILTAHGGGCHEAIGATVLVRTYGAVTSTRGLLPNGDKFEQWTLASSSAPPPPVALEGMWPRPEERDQAERTPVATSWPDDVDGWWVARADAVPDEAVFTTAQVVWAAGSRTWRRLAARGIWVNGCADGLGDAEVPALDQLAGRTVVWRRLSHTSSDDPDAVATYSVHVPLPDDLASRTHFYWTSGSLFLDALQRYPAIRNGWHGCGPGRTSRVVYDALGAGGRISIWLDYDQWHQHVTRP
jgi:hydroxymethylbilane synthase